MPLLSWFTLPATECYKETRGRILASKWKRKSGVLEFSFRRRCFASASRDLLPSRACEQTLGPSVVYEHNFDGDKCARVLLFVRVEGASSDLRFFNVERRNWRGVRFSPRNIP
jgi:hypothetical protein